MKELNAISEIVEIPNFLLENFNEINNENFSSDNYSNYLEEFDSFNDSDRNKYL